MRQINLALAVLVLTACIAHGDTFDNLSVFQPGGVLQPITATGVNTFTWSLPPSTQLGGQGWLVFSFEIAPIAAVIQTVLSLDGYETVLTKEFVDGRLCGAGKCVGSASIFLPRFYGTKTGTVHFTFSGQDSRTYQFQLMEPVPEPGSLLLMGSGILAVAAKVRKRWAR